MLRGKKTNHLNFSLMDDPVWKIINPLPLMCKKNKVRSCHYKNPTGKNYLFPALSSPIVRIRNLLELIFKKLDQLKQVLFSEGNGNSLTVLL